MSERDYAWLIRTLRRVADEYALTPTGYVIWLLREAAATIERTTTP